MSSRILPIRVDGNERIGYGHFYRALSLANILRGKYQSYFYHKDLDKNLIDKLILQGFDQYKLSGKFNENDEVKFLSSIYPGQEKLIVLDGYQFSDRYQLALKEAGFKIIHIADEESSVQYSDVIISQAPRENSPYGAKIFAGFEYSLLREEFYDEINIKRIISKTDTVFIMFGSSPVKGIASKILGAFLKMPIVKEIHMIKPLPSVFNDELIPLIQQNKDKIHLYDNLGASEIVELINKSDFGFVPSSVASLEVCTVGLGLFSGYTATNQISTYQNHIALKTIFPLGDLDIVSEEEILKILMSETYPVKINSQIENQKKAFKDNSKLILEIFSYI